jgi:hypothetical protein
MRNRRGTAPERAATRRRPAPQDEDVCNHISPRLRGKLTPIADSVSINRFHGWTMRRAQNVQFLLTPSVRRALIPAEECILGAIRPGAVNA